MELFRLTCLLGLLISYSTALQVTPNSPCASFCINSEGDDVSDPNSSTTTNKDITCLDSEYTSRAGQKYQRCMSCLQDSTFSQGSESDQLWFLYNLRYTFDNCIFGFPNATGNPSTPCSTSTACGALESALTSDNLRSNNLDYSYCDVDGGVMTSTSVTKCTSCVAASDDQGFLVNYLVALEAGCNQRSTPGGAIGLSDTVFSTTQINAIDPVSKASKDNQPTLPTTTIVGIAVAAVVVILAIAGFFFVRHRKSRNRRLRLEGGARSGSSLRRGQHRPASSLSFRCQTHLTPRSPSFPNQHSAIDEEEKGYSNPHVALGPHPMTAESPVSRMSRTSWQPQATSPSFCRPRQAPQPLQNISTTAPAFPDNVHYSTSPKASRFFSPHEDIPIPSSTTSTRSTAQLLPLRPYNPAEYGVSSPHIGSPAEGSSSYASPVSGSTASPLLGRIWERQSQSQSQNQESMAPIWEMPPQRETTVVTTVTVPAAHARPRALERIRVPTSPRKKPMGGAGSPVESTEISTVFPGPPSPGSRWRRG
ncbi:hypothetical protein F5X97DRAFT_148000 [Nemania serpens]|nr:hypothetical protein F5X97DRAFT_148000 [Nemania serpens]